MKRLLFLATGIALIATFVMINSCSNNSTTPVVLQPGDTNSPVYQSASEVFGQAEDISAQAIMGTLVNAEGFFGGAPGSSRGQTPHSALADTLIYHDQTGYWYAASSETDTSYVGDIGSAIEEIHHGSRVDSIQFMHGMTPVQYPDSALLTEIKAGSFWLLYSEYGHDTIRATHAVSIEGAAGAIAGHGDVVINGTGAIHAAANNETPEHDSTMSCDITASLTASFANIGLNLQEVFGQGGCPTSGVMSHTGTLGFDCASPTDTLQFNGHWSASRTYNNGEVTYVYENATTRWTVTDSCGQSAPTVAPFRLATLHEIFK